MRKVFGEESPLTGLELGLWTQLIKEIAQLSDVAENLADRIRLALDMK